MNIGLWIGAVVLAVMAGLAGLDWTRNRRRDRRRQSRANRSKAHHRAWNLVYGRRRHLRLAHHRDREAGQN
ncbi:MAG: hypothetical protein V4659_01035 [Pseudomonadota bacterium]